MKTTILTYLFTIIYTTMYAQYMELYVKVITKQNDTIAGILLHPETNVIYKFKPEQNIFANKQLFYEGQIAFTLYQKIEICNKTAFATNTTNVPPIDYPQFWKIGYYVENTAQTFKTKEVSKIIYQKKRRPKYNTSEVDFELPEVSPEMAKTIQTKPLINRIINDGNKNVIYDDNGNAFAMYNFNPNINEAELKRLGELYKKDIFKKKHTDVWPTPAEYIQTSKKAIAALQKKQIIIYQYYIGD